MKALNRINAWVNFKESILFNLEENGYKYFVFVVQSGAKKLYPYKTYSEALDKQGENSHLCILDNHLMVIDQPLINISKGNVLADVMVLI